MGDKVGGLPAHELVIALCLIKPYRPNSKKRKGGQRKMLGVTEREH